MALDETRTAGETGHLADHNYLHALQNNDVALWVNHGATAGMARPTVAGSAAPFVIWVGTVSPTNALATDIWIDNS